MASQPSFRFAPPATALQCGPGVVDLLGDVVAARSLCRVALVLAEVMGFNAPALPADKAALLARVFADDPRRGARRMLARLGLRAGLGRFIMPEEVPGLAAASLQSGNIATTPRTSTRAEVERILHASLPDNGEEP